MTTPVDFHYLPHYCLTASCGGRLTFLFVLWIYGFSSLSLWRYRRYSPAFFFCLFSLFKVPGDRGTNHRAFPPHIPGHGRRGDVPASQRPQPRQQRPLPAVELRRHSAAGGRVGGPPVERPGAARQVPRTPVCARALVLLHAAHQEESLLNVPVPPRCSCTSACFLPPGHFLRQSSYSHSQNSSSSSSPSSSSISTTSSSASFSSLQ